MDKRQAQEIIRETFESPFDKARFMKFIKDLLNRIDESKAFHAHGYVKEGFRGVIKTYERIGTYNSADDKKIDIIIVYLQKGFSLDHARVTQRNFAGRYLADRDNKNAGLFAFVSPEESDWRFSLVTIDYEIVQSKAGNWKGQEKFSQARRWSFLVGENEKSHTAQSRLVKILANDEQDPTLKEIEQAFDIESVTKEFFLKYRELFLHTKEELDRVVKKDPKIKADFEAKGVDTVNFAKKLLGQIIFLYFLQKKGWFGVGRDDDWDTGSKHFLRELFEKKHGDYNNFFNDILEPLFYDALRNDRSHDDGYYSRFNCKIPFLNGGLFDPIGNYDWVKTDIIIPDKLFSNNVKTKEDDTGTGILDVFDRYNFTVKEDEPLEKEVAIDPELLGKSYEKFNAIRLDNYAEFKKALKSGKKGEENKFNKKFGVYYTPREIVHYMCQQSLINYLDTSVNTHKKHWVEKLAVQNKLFGPQEHEQLTLLSVSIPKEDIEALIHIGEQVGENEAIFLEKKQKIKKGGQKTTSIKSKLPDSIRKNAKLIDDKLAEITVCDPAVGSGAFPVGMMSEIVKIRNVLTLFLSLRGAQATKQSQFDDNRTVYNFKRQCIEHSLYGVDIDPGAVEIAKLRLWLSLVVDEENIKNIKPLPNLDYKIMQGNSLIELLSTESLVSSIDQRRTELVKELKKAKDKLFNITMPTQKENKRREIDILMKKLFEYDRDKQIKRLKDHILAVKSQQRLFEDDKDKKEDEKKIRVIESRIEEIKNIDVPGPTEHFEWHVNYSEIFQAKGGFDVVIANPPYVFTRNADFNVSFKNDIDKLYFSKLKKSKKSKANQSGKINLFALFILKGLFELRKNGFLCYIIPNNILRTTTYDTIRKYMLDNTKITNIVDLGSGVFDKVTASTVVIALQACKHNSERKHNKVGIMIDIVSLEQGQYNSSFVDQLQFESNTSFAFNIYLDKEALQLSNKIETDKERLGIYCHEIMEGIVAHKQFIKNELSTKTVPLIEGKSIKRYCLSRPTKFLVWDKSKIHRPRPDYLWESGEKIIIQRISGGSNPLTATLDTNNHKTFASVNNLLLKQEFKPYYQFILSLLNSRVLNWYYANSFSNNSELTVNISKTYLEQLPIPKLLKFNDDIILHLTEIVDHILSITKSDDYLQNTQKQAKVKSLEAEIDQLVYKLYDLTEEEIKIVESSS